MAKGQKEAVVELVVKTLGSNFQSGVTNVLSIITSSQLAKIKQEVYDGIIQGAITYSKSTSSRSEVKTYASSMVMNHLKKAKELNGGGGSTVSVLKATSSATNASYATYGLDVNSLPDYVKSVLNEKTVL
jgi:hypothetical protein